MENNQQAQGSLQPVLGLRSLIFYGMAFLVPTTFFTTYGIVTEATHGMVSITYIITTICMIFTAYSYCRMSNAFPNSGAIYTYASETFNPSFGFFAGWTIILGYIFLPMLNFLSSSIFMKQLFPSIPIWVWIVLFAIVVTALNLMGVKVADLYNNIVVVFQIIFIITFLIMLFRYLIYNDIGLSFEAFFNEKEFKNIGGVSGIMAGSAIVCLSFLGFDGIAALGEEAINPTKNIPKAIMICCVGMGIMFVVYTYLLQVAWPTAWSELTDFDGAASILVTRIAGEFMKYFFVVGYILGQLACAISSVLSASRILYGMGRKGTLPRKVFGYVNPKTNVPSINIIILGLFGLTALFFSLTVASCLINFGALIGFAFVNICVIKYYFINNKNKQTSDYIRHFLSPFIGLLFVLYMIINLNATSIFYGIIWEIIGLIWLVYITKGFRKQLT